MRKGENRKTAVCVLDSCVVVVLLSLVVDPTVGYSSCLVLPSLSLSCQCRYLQRATCLVFLSRNNINSRIVVVLVVSVVLVFLAVVLVVDSSETETDASSVTQ
ncbi:hypothetical protein ACLKA7_006197 [Drosophila subpalustris]